MGNRCVVPLQSISATRWADFDFALVPLRSRFFLSLPLSFSFFDRLRGGCHATADKNAPRISIRRTISDHTMSSWSPSLKDISPVPRCWTIFVPCLTSSPKVIASARHCSRFLDLPVLLPTVPFLRPRLERVAGCRLDGTVLPSSEHTFTLWHKATQTFSPLVLTTTGSSYDLLFLRGFFLGYPALEEVCGKLHSDHRILWPLNGGHSARTRIDSGSLLIGRFPPVVSIFKGLPGSLSELSPALTTARCKRFPSSSAGFSAPRGHRPSPAF